MALVAAAPESIMTVSCESGLSFESSDKAGGALAGALVVDMEAGVMSSAGANGALAMASVAEVSGDGKKRPQGPQLGVQS